MLAVAITVAFEPKAAFAAGSDPMYRLYNQWSGEHLFTTDGGEYGSLAGIGWQQEGVAWQSPQDGDNVYRLYNPYSGDHFYTGDKAEYDRLGSIGWNQEGISFHSANSGGRMPIYRLFNQWLIAGTHLFTTDKAEYDHLCSIGWSGEGVAFYGSQDQQPEVNNDKPEVNNDKPRKTDEEKSITNNADNEYKIAIDLGDEAADADAPRTPQVYTNDSGDITIGAPSHSDYEFRGWKVNDSSDLRQKVVIPHGSTGDIKLKAVWAPKTAYIYNKYTQGQVKYQVGIPSIKGNILNRVYDKTNGETESVSVQSDAKNASEVTKGSIVIVNSYDAINGVAIKVNNITDQNGTRTISGSCVEPNMVIESLDLEDNTNTSKGFETASEIQSMGAIDVDNNSISVSITNDFINKHRIIDADDSISGHIHPFDIGGDLKAVGKTDITIKPEAKYNIHWSLADGFHNNTYFNIATSATISSEGSVSGKGWIHICNVPNDFGIPESIVRLDTDFQVESNVNIGMSYNLNYDKTINIEGYNITNSGPGVKSSGLTSFMINGKAAVGFNMSPTVALLGQNFFDCGAEFGMKASGSSQYRSNKLTCTDIGTWAYAEASVGTHTKWIKDILNLNKVTLNWVFMDEDNSPIKKSWHMENGKYIDHCTWESFLNREFVASGTIRVMNYFEMVEFQGFSPYPYTKDIDNDKLTAVLVLDKETEITCAQSGDSGLRSGTVFMVRLPSSFATRSNDYKRATITFDPEKVFWPSDATMPLGQPSSAEASIVSSEIQDSNITKQKTLSALNGWWSTVGHNMDNPIYYHFDNDSVSIFDSNGRPTGGASVSIDWHVSGFGQNNTTSNSGPYQGFGEDGIKIHFAGNNDFYCLSDSDQSKLTYHCFDSRLNLQSNPDKNLVKLSNPPAITS